MVEDTMFSGESKNIEYKVFLPDKNEKYMKTIVAFANTQGGKLIVGVDDKTHQIIFHSPKHEENVLSEKEIEILNLVRMQPSITQKEMANALDWNLASVKYYITKLKEKKYLTRQGSSQKGKWLILTLVSIQVKLCNVRRRERCLENHH